MPRADEVKISYIAEIKDLREKLKSIPDLTAAEAKATTQALAKAIKATEKAQNRAISNAKKTASASADAAKQARDGVTNVAKASKLAIPAMGELGEKIGGAIEGFSAMGPAGVALGAALGGVAAVGGVVALGVAILELQEYAYEAIPALEKLEAAGIDLMSADAVGNITDAHFAMEGVTVAADALSVTLASDLAPGIERVMVDTVAFILLLKDQKQAIYDDIAAFASYGDTVASVASALAPVATMLGQSGLGTALAAGAASWQAARSGVTLFSEGLEEGEIALGDYIVQAQEVIDANRRITESQEKGKASGKEAQDEALLAAEAIKKASLEGAKAAEKHAKEQAQLAKEQARARAQAQADAEAQMALDRMVYEGKLSLAMASAQGVADIASWVSSENIEAARAAWAVESAAAVIQAGLNVPLAISNASTLPPPANIPAMAMAAIQSGIALGSVVAAAAKNIPQAYGGIDLGYAASTGTVVQVATHPGERARIETRSEVERSKRGAGGPTMVETWINGRSVATTVAEQIRSGGALTAELTRRTGRLGHTPAFRSA